MSKVNVYHGESIVARVDYTDNLDTWNGSNWQAGGTGLHLGVTRLKKPVDGKKYVLVHGSQWQGTTNTAQLVSDEEAKQAILQAENTELLEKYFPTALQELDIEE